MLDKAIDSFLAAILYALWFVLGVTLAYIVGNWLV